MGRASDLLKEFSARLAALESRAEGLQRIITSLEGIKEVFSSNTAGIRKDTDHVEQMITEYLEQKEAALIEVENLKAAHREVEQVISRMDIEYQAVLSMRYLAGYNQSDAAKKMRIPRETLKSREAHALALLDYHLK